MSIHPGGTDKGRSTQHTDLAIPELTPFYELTAPEQFLALQIALIDTLRAYLQSAGAISSRAKDQLLFGIGDPQRLGAITAIGSLPDLQIAVVQTCLTAPANYKDPLEDSYSTRAAEIIWMLDPDFSVTLACAQQPNLKDSVLPGGNVWKRSTLMAIATRLLVAHQVDEASKKLIFTKVLSFIEATPATENRGRDLRTILVEWSRSEGKNGLSQYNLPWETIVKFFIECKTGSFDEGLAFISLVPAESMLSAPDRLVKLLESINSSGGTYYPIKPDHLDQFAHIVEVAPAVNSEVFRQLLRITLLFVEIRINTESAVTSEDSEKSQQQLDTLIKIITTLTETVTTMIESDKPEEQLESAANAELLRLLFIISARLARASDEREIGGIKQGYENTQSGLEKPIISAASLEELKKMSFETRSRTDFLTAIKTFGQREDFVRSVVPEEGLMLWMTWMEKITKDRHEFNLPRQIADVLEYVYGGNLRVMVEDLLQCHRQVWIENEPRATTILSDIWYEKAYIEMEKISASFTVNQDENTPPRILDLMLCELAPDEKIKDISQKRWQAAVVNLGEVIICSTSLDHALRLEYYTYLRKYASFPKRLVSILLDEIPLQAAGSLVLEKDFIRGRDLIEIIRAIAEKSLKTALTLNFLLNGITPAQTKDPSWMQEFLHALTVWYSINKAEPIESVNEISTKLQALARSTPTLATLLVELGIAAPPRVAAQTPEVTS